MKKAQSILEYGFVLSIVLVALFGMNTYLKRGIQSAVKIAADEVGTQDEFENIHPRFVGEQIPSPVITTTRGVATATEHLPEGASQRTVIAECGVQTTYIDTTTTTSGGQESSRELY